MLTQIIAIDDEKEYLNLIGELAALSSCEAILYTCWNDEILQDLKSDTLLILDIHMPTQDGIDILMELSKANFKGGIAVLSGADETIINSVLKLGDSLGLNMLEHLSKPFLLQAFRSIVSRFNVSQEVTESSKKQVKNLSLDLEDLSHYLSKSWMYPVYQPQINLDNYLVFGVECLSRMKHPKYGDIPPPLFIDYLTKKDLIGDYTLLLIEKAFVECGSILKEKPSFVISFNISALSLNQVFTTKIFELVERHQLKPSQITIEITETNAITLSEEALYSVSKYRAYGFNLSIDDFGTGYSTIMQLNDLPFTELKIDKSFVDKISQSEKSLNLVRSTVMLAANLSLKTVAEGVETEEQLQLIRDMGCDAVQGYIFSKPLSINDLIDFIHSENKQTPSV